MSPYIWILRYQNLCLEFPFWVKIAGIDVEAVSMCWMCVVCNTGLRAALQPLIPVRRPSVRARKVWPGQIRLTRRSHCMTHCYERSIRSSATSAVQVQSAVLSMLPAHRLSVHDSCVYTFAASNRSTYLSGDCWMPVAAGQCFFSDFSSVL